MLTFRVVRVFMPSFCELRMAVIFLMMQRGDVSLRMKGGSRHFIFSLSMQKDMEKKLYVGNLSYNTTADDLRTLFSQAGVVETVDLIKDRESGRSKGFAFIEMSTQSEAEKAISMFNGQNFDNRALKVNIARPREEKPRRSGGYGGYDNRRSGYNNRDRNTKKSY